MVEIYEIQCDLARAPSSARPPAPVPPLPAVSMRRAPPPLPRSCPPPPPPSAPAPSVLSHLTISEEVLLFEQVASVSFPCSAFSCELALSCNYIFMSPKYKPPKGGKLVCLFHYSVPSTNAN